MNLFLYKKLSQDLLKILGTLRITCDGVTPLSEQDFFYLLIDHDSSDDVANRIDNFENNYGFKDSIKIIYEEKISLQKLLGDTLYKNLLSKKERNFQYYYWGENIFPATEYTEIFQSQKKAFDHICQKYFIPCSLNAYDMFINLLSLGISFLSGTSVINPKFSSNNTHIPAEYSVEQFASCVKKHKKIVISGLPGTGKTTLISWFLNKYRMDFVYLIYSDSLKQTFSQEIFSGITGFDGNLSVLNEKESLSLLIIDNMNPDKNNFMKEVAKLASLKMRVIIITTHTICPLDFHMYSAPLFTNEELFLIIPDNFPCEIAPENLFRFTGKNPYLLSLLVSTSIKSPDALYKLLKESEVFPTKAVLPRFKHLPYHSTNTDFWGHANKVYTLYRNKKDYQLHRKHLKILSCFYDYEIPLDFVKYIFSEYNENVIQELTDMGYLQFIDGENKVRLSPAMANIIFSHEKPSYSDPILSHVINNSTFPPA